jgi:RNA polymerase sigma-70 factor (ECF subfamily)
MDETELIQLAQGGDLDAFNRIVIAHQDLAYNLAYRLLNDPAAAEDATQDAFISAYRNLARFRGGSFKAWLLRIVTNGCYDELRRQKRRPITDLEPQNEESESFDSAVWMVDPGESPEDMALRVELNAAIQRCLEGLDEEFRAAIVLVDVQGLDYAEAASALNRPLGTVKSRLARGRGRLQECLQGFEELLPSEFRLVSEGQ